MATDNPAMSTFPSARTRPPARFDTRALTPPQVALDELANLAAQPALALALSTWADGCQAGACSTALLQGTQTPALHALAQAWARERDGSHRLQALGRLAGLLWRLQVKLNDGHAGRARQPGDPWDAGWPVAQAAGHQQLAEVWLPRRATLLLADAVQVAELAPVLARLQARAGAWRQPVAWLWLASPAQAAALVVDGPRLTMG